MKPPSFKEKVITVSLLFLMPLLMLSSNASGTMPQWRDIGREISLQLYLSAWEDTLNLNPATQWERDRKALVMAFLGKKLRQKGWYRYLNEISDSSPYRQAANLLLQEQVVVPEAIQGEKAPISPFMRKFYSLWRINRSRALRFLSWAPDIPEKRRAVQIAFNRLFYEGEDEMLMAIFKRFGSLKRSTANLRKMALAHWREGELREALGYTNKALKRSPGNRELLFWKARILQRLGRIDASTALLRRVAKGIGGGFYPWYSRMLLGRLRFMGNTCEDRESYPDPVLYAMAESGLTQLGQKVLKEESLSGRHPDLLSSSWLYPYQSLRLSYLQNENGDTCTRYPHPWEEAMREFCDLYGIQEEMLYALIRTESSFNSKTRSYSNAQGLTQVLPSTGRWIMKQKGKSYRLYPNLAFIPFFSLQLGGWYLQYLENQFHGRWPLVVASYNGGPGRTKRWLKRFPHPDLEEVAAFYPLYQTRKYVKRLFYYQLRYLGASPLSE